MNLKKTIAFWDLVMTAINFAEANDYKTALQVLKNTKPTGLSKHDVSPEEIHNKTSPS